MGWVWWLIVIVMIGIAVNAIDNGEINSPSNWVNEEQILVYADQVVLDIPNARWARFTDTNSMDPFIDIGSNAIEIIPHDPLSINVGDIISYQSGSSTIIHRVNLVGSDDKGIYYKVKGDNNKFTDPVKVRFEDVEGVVVAVVY